MSVLVTGAAGFIGSHVVDALLAEGEVVVGLDCYDDYYSPEVKRANLSAARASERFSEVQGDLCDPSVLESVPPGVTSVVHLAARAGVRPSIENPRLYGKVNVDGTLAVLDWMRDRGVRDLVFASSSSVYGNNEKVPFSEEDPVDYPISPYAATKRASELICHTYHHLFGISIVALRFFTVYGPRQRPDLAIHKFARLLRDGEAIPFFGDGSSERDYTYISDILQGIQGALRFTAAEQPVFEIVNLGESRTVTLSELVEVLAEEMGVTPELKRLPAQPGDVRRTYADISKASRILGYRPCIGFREGIRGFLAWFDGHG